MADRVLVGFARIRTTAWAFERADFAVIDDNSDGIEDAYQNLSTGQKTNSSEAARALFGGILPSGGVAQILTWTNPWRSMERALVGAQTSLYVPSGRGNVSINGNSGDAQRFGIKFSPGGDTGRVQGRHSFYGVRYRTTNPGPWHWASSLSNEPFDNQNRFESIHYVDVCSQGGFNFRTKTGQGPDKWIERSQQNAGFFVLGGSFGGNNREHLFYSTQFRGPMVFRFMEVYFLGRTITQLFARATEEDLVPSTGYVYHEGIYAQDVCADQDSGGFSFRSRNYGENHNVDSFVSLGNDELSFLIDGQTGAHKKYKQAWQSSMGEHNLYPRNVITPRLLIDSGIFYTGAQRDMDSETIQLHGGTREFVFRRTVATGWKRSLVFSLVFWDQNQEGSDGSPNPGFGDPIVEKVRLDVRSIVIGKCAVSPDIGVDWVWDDPNSDGSGYRNMLRDPRVLADSRFVIFDSDDEEGGADELRFSSSCAVATTVTATIDISGGNQINIEATIPIPAPAVSLYGFTAKFPDAPDAKNDWIASATQRIQRPSTGGGDGEENIDIEARVEIQAPLILSRIASMDITLPAAPLLTTVTTFFDIQEPGGGDEEPQTFPPVIANTLASLLPVGPAWNAKLCEGTVMYELTQAWSSFLDQVYQQSRLLLNERFPAHSRFMAAEWIREFDLPRRCANNDELEQAIDQLKIAHGLWYLYGIGGSSPLLVEQVPALFGYEVTIERSLPATPGMCGEMECGTALDDGSDAIYFKVTAHGEGVDAECGVAQCGEPMGYFEFGGLHCLLEQLKPAHTKFIVVISDCGVWRDSDPWDGQQSWSHC